MDVKLIEVHSFISPIDASLVKNILELEGIDSVINNEHINTSFAFHQPAIGGVRLMVREADYDIAKRIVNRTLAEQQNDEMQVEFDEEEWAYQQEQQEIQEKNQKIISKGVRIGLVLFGLLSIALYYLLAG
ncbi:MAG: DUF2007 domain-containing protein [Bacteroidota bacterium]